MEQFENVNVNKKANIYFDGKCVSHTINCLDGSRKTVGVIFPSSLVFNTGEPETMEILDGCCRVRQKDQSNWQEFKAGNSFKIPGDSEFEIETIETVHYVCHFG